MNVSDLGKGLKLLGIPNSHADMGKACVPLHIVATISFLNYVFLLYFLAREMHPHQLCYIKTYETLKKHKMKMDVVCVADNLVKLGILPCSCTEL